MCLSTPKIPAAPKAPAMQAPPELSAGDALGLILGGKRSTDPTSNYQTFGKNALRIALNGPDVSGLQIPKG